MKMLCKVPDALCPHDMNICCGTCDKKVDCPQCCDSITESGDCPNAEVVNDELAQFERAVPEAIKQITDLMVAKKTIEDREKELKAQLIRAMETYGVKSFDNDLIRITYVAPTTRTAIDSTRLKKDHPDIAEQYSKTSNVAASVRIAVK